jgi:hypothetical protein
MAAFEDFDPTNFVRHPVSFDKIFNETNMGRLLQDGYAIIDPFFEDAFACGLLSEIRDMASSGRMEPNRTSFASSGDPSKVLLFSKPNIFEVDLHQQNVFKRVIDQTCQTDADALQSRYDCLESLFNESRDKLARAMQAYIPTEISDIKLTGGDSGRTIKLQWNKGAGGCFPW